MARRKKIRTDLPKGSMKKTDTEFASMHDGKVTGDRFEGYNAPFSTPQGWFSNNWVTGTNKDPKGVGISQSTKDR